MAVNEKGFRGVALAPFPAGVGYTTRRGGGAGRIRRSDGSWLRPWRESHRGPRRVAVAGKADVREVVFRPGLVQQLPVGSGAIGGRRAEGEPGGMRTEVGLRTSPEMGRKKK